MLKSLKDLLWLGTAVSLSLGAVLLTLDFTRSYDGLLQNLSSFIQTHKRSVTLSGAGLSNEASNFDTYTGLDILYGLRSWKLEGAEVSINGTVIPDANEDGALPSGLYDQDLGLAVALLALEEDYEAYSLLDKQGRLAKISFKLK